MSGDWDQEKKKLYGRFALLALAAALAGAAFGICVSRSMQKWACSFAEGAVAVVHEHYPDAEEEVVQELLSGAERSAGDSILEKYGIEFANLPVAANGRNLAAVILDGGIFIPVINVIFAVFIIGCYRKSQRKKMRDMEQYCRRILEDCYDLDLRDNEEGDLSRLKNDIYDITVMLNEKNHHLEQNKKDTEQLIADISHQLKTPLTTLNMVNDLLYLDLPEEKRREFLDDMQRELMKIEWLIKTMLNQAKLDSRTLILKKQPEEAEKMLAESVRHFSVLCELNNCQIQYACAPETTVLCDRKWTLEAIHNILKNAIEHGAKRIRIVAEENRLYTQIKIEDDGEGIDKNDLGHIFERFYKAKNSSTESMGLGLAFAKSIIVNQGGEIRAESASGKGTTFSLKLYRES